MGYITSKNAPNNSVKPAMYTFDTMSSFCRTWSFRFTVHLQYISTPTKTEFLPTNKIKFHWVRWSRWEMKHAERRKEIWPPHYEVMLRTTHIIIKQCKHQHSTPLFVLFVLLIRHDPLSVEFEHNHFLEYKETNYSHMQYHPCNFNLYSILYGYKG